MHAVVTGETSARTVDQVVAVGTRLRVVKIFAHVQAVALVASSRETSKGTECCGSRSGLYMYNGIDSCSSCCVCEKRDKYTDGCNQSNKQ